MPANNRLTTYQITKDYTSVPRDVQVPKARPAPKVSQNILDKLNETLPGSSIALHGASNDFSRYELVNSMFAHSATKKKDALHTTKASSQDYDISDTKVVGKISNSNDSSLSDSVRISSYSEDDSPINLFASNLAEQPVLALQMSVKASDDIIKSKTVINSAAQDKSSLNDDGQEIHKTIEATQKIDSELLFTFPKKPLKSETTFEDYEPDVGSNSELVVTENPLVEFDNKLNFHEASNNHAGFALVGEDFYYDSNRQQSQPTSLVIDNSSDFSDFDYFGDEDLYDEILQTGLNLSNTSDSLQPAELVAFRSSISKFISSNASIANADAFSDDLFQGFLDYSPEELFNHLSPQEIKMFKRKSRQMSMELNELSMATKPKGRRREVSVIADRKSSYNKPSSRHSKVLTDFSLNKMNSLSRPLSNSFLKELNCFLESNPPDSENDEKPFLSFMESTQQVTHSLKFQKNSSKDFKEEFESPIVTVNSVVLQYSSDAPKPEINPQVIRSLSDKIVPISGFDQSVHETSIAHHENAEAADDNKDNVNAEINFDQGASSDNSSNSNGFAESASSTGLPSNLSSDDTETMGSVSSINPSTLWVEGDLNNITLEAREQIQVATKPDNPLSSTKPVQDFENMSIPTSKNIGTKLSNTVDVIAGHSCEFSFESLAKDKTTLHLSKKPNHGRMFKMSVREKPLTSSKPSWYVAPHGPSTTTTSDMSTNSVESSLNTFQSTAKSVGGMPVSSIYFCADKKVDPLVPDTNVLVDEQLENPASEPLMKNKEEAVEKETAGIVKLESPARYRKSKYTTQVKHNFVECFEDIDEFVQNFDAKTDVMVNNGASVAAAAAATVNTTNETPITLDDCKKTASSLKSQPSAENIPKLATTSAPANFNTESEKKHSVIAELKRSFSKDVHKLKSYSSKDVALNKPLQSVAEKPSTRKKFRKRSKTTTQYDEAIEELSQEIDTLKSTMSIQALSNKNENSSEALEKTLISGSDITSHGSTPSKTAQLVAENNDNPADEIKNGNAGGKKLREVLHSVKFKIRNKFGNEKNQASM